MSDGFGSDGEFEYGRPRYQDPSASAAGLPRRTGNGTGGGDEVNRTAPGAIVALVLASVAWLLPVLGGIIVIRRATAALNVVEAAGGELDGAPLAVWARRLGWFYVLAWSLLLFYWFGGQLFQLVYRFLVK